MVSFYRNITGLCISSPPNLLNNKTGPLFFIVQIKLLAKSVLQFSHGKPWSLGCWDIPQTRGIAASMKLGVLRISQGRWVVFFYMGVPLKSELSTKISASFFQVTLCFVGFFASHGSIFVWKRNHLKMHFLLKMVMFQCHVTVVFRGLCTPKNECIFFSQPMVAGFLACFFWLTSGPVGGFFFGNFPAGHPQGIFVHENGQEEKRTLNRRCLSFSSNENLFHGDWRIPKKANKGDYFQGQWWAKKAWFPDRLCGIGGGEPRKFSRLLCLRNMLFWSFCLLTFVQCVAGMVASTLVQRKGQGFELRKRWLGMLVCEPHRNSSCMI